MKIDRIYKIEINEEQLNLLSEALDLYAQAYDNDIDETETDIFVADLHSKVILKQKEVPNE